MRKEIWFGLSILVAIGRPKAFDARSWARNAAAALFWVAFCGKIAER